jgi:hypothetical protein
VAAVGLEGRHRPQIYLALVSPIHPHLLVLDSTTSLTFLLLQPVVFVVVKKYVRSIVYDYM